MLHGAPVTTFDLDVVHSRDEGNVSRLLSALEELEAVYRSQPERRLRPGEGHLAGPGHQLLLTKFGPLDVLGMIGKSRTWEDLAGGARTMEIDAGVVVRVLDLETLIAVKEELGFPKDVAMLPVLRRALRERGEQRGAMNTQTSLVADAGTLRVRARGPAIGGIWSDFVVVILRWWANALLKIIQNNGSQERVHFMEGPYAVDVCLSSEMLHFRLISRDSEVGTVDAALGPFVSALTLQTREVLHACRLQRWWSADADALESLVAQLEREVAHL